MVPGFASTLESGSVVEGINCVSFITHLNAVRFFYFFAFLFYWKDCIIIDTYFSNVTLYGAFTAVPANPATIAYIQVKANGNVDCVAWKVTILVLVPFSLNGLILS